jgi:hypothetical protein
VDSLGTERALLGLSRAISCSFHTVYIGILAKNYRKMVVKIGKIGKTGKEETPKKHTKKRKKDTEMFKKYAKTFEK